MRCELKSEYQVWVRGADEGWWPFDADDWEDVLDLLTEYRDEENFVTRRP